MVRTFAAIGFLLVAVATTDDLLADEFFDAETSLPKCLLRHIEPRTVADHRYLVETGIAGLSSIDAKADRLAAALERVIQRMHRTMREEQALVVALQDDEVPSGDRRTWVKEAIAKSAQVVSYGLMAENLAQLAGDLGPDVDVKPALRRYADLIRRYGFCTDVETARFEAQVLIELSLLRREGSAR